MHFQPFTDRSGEGKIVFLFLKDCAYSKMKGSEHGATMHFQIENKGTNNIQSSLCFHRNNLHTLYKFLSIN